MDLNRLTRSTACEGLSVVAMAIVIRDASIGIMSGALRPRPPVVSKPASFSKRAIHDAAYAGELSLATDLRVLTRTASVVVRGTGC